MKYPFLTLALILIGFSIPATVTAADCNMAEAGKALAEKDRCAMCHKQGGMAQPLAGITEGKTDEFLKQSIINPKEALGPKTRMPAYKYSEEEVNSMIQYLRSLSKP